MTSFTEALLSSNILTSNGAISYSSPDINGKYTARLTLYFKCNRDLNILKLYSMLNDSARENLLDTFLIVFNLRDCRGGKGERNLAKKAWIWLFINYPNEFSKIIYLIPEYGRWDDVLCFWPRILDLKLVSVEYISKNYCSKLHSEESREELKRLQLEFVKLIGNQLIKDKQSMLKGEPISLCAKWAPSEKGILNSKYQSVSLLCKTMNWSLTEYRKDYLTPLRKNLQ